MRKQPPLSFTLGTVGFVLAMVGVAGWAAWPIYQNLAFVLLVAVSAIVGTAIALLGARRSWSWLTVCLLAIAAYLVLGVPLAVPSALTGLTEIAGGWLDFVTATVFGWKQLVTISLPVGSYQAVLVPALVIFLFGTVAAMSFALRLRRLAFLAVVVTLGMQVFGLAFGSSATSGDIALGPLDIAAPREVVVSIVGFLVALFFLLWRVTYARRQSIASAQLNAGIRQSREPVASMVRRLTLGVAIMLIAVLVSAVVSPALAGANQRQVLRSSIDPETARLVRESPLAQYRSYFKNDYDTDLFTVTSTAATPVRVRLATLSYFDGQYFTAIDPSTGDGTDLSQFARVPFRLQPETDGTPATVSVTIDDYSGLWLPTAGELVQATFSGTNGTELADGFFYNPRVGAGIEAAPLSSGDSYTLDVVVPATSVDLTTLTPPSRSQATIAPELIPDRLIEWTNAQPDSSSLSALVTSLRERGFLSHTVDAPASTDPWIQPLTDYAWSPSEAGHSIDRIDYLFDQMLALEKLGVSPDTIPVAGVGDDEQFSVAVALVAQHLGYASRVVLGFTTGGNTLEADEIPSCETTCKGQNLSAWAEVQDGATGQWVSVDATPQHTHGLANSNPDQKLPERPTVVIPPAATPQDPPAANPSGSEQTTSPQSSTTEDLTWLVTLLKTVGLALLLIVILLAPFATILFAKARRRSQRRKARDPEVRIVGGWDEYLDVALDHGYSAPLTETRAQIARGFRTPHGVTLAVMADRAVFGPTDPDDSESDRFWQILEDERLAFARGMSRWQRWRAAFSLRSFTQFLARRASPNTRSRSE